MKIVAEGKLPDLSGPWIGECHNCHAKVECSRGELIREGRVRSADLET